tara:strand:- start:33434 stop:33583 length:150 start_codon:yes stop_codon:yes gene_type:complete
MNKKNQWNKPEITEHGNMEEITKGIAQFGGAKEVGGDDGGTWLGQAVSS